MFRTSLWPPTSWSPRANPRGARWAGGTQNPKQTQEENKADDGQDAPDDDPEGQEEQRRRVPHRLLSVLRQGLTLAPCSARLHAIRREDHVPAHREGPDQALAARAHEPLRKRDRFVEQDARMEVRLHRDHGALVPGDVFVPGEQGPEGRERGVAPGPGPVAG